MIAFSMYIETKALDRRYDLVVKGQDQTYLKLAYGSKHEHLFHFFT